MLFNNRLLIIHSLNSYFVHDFDKKTGHIWKFQQESDIFCKIVSNFLSNQVISEYFHNWSNLHVSWDRFTQTELKKLLDFLL